MVYDTTQASDVLWIMGIIQNKLTLADTQTQRQRLLDRPKVLWITTLEITIGPTTLVFLNQNGSAMKAHRFAYILARTG
jgi:hypothetical protein